METITRDPAPTHEDIDDIHSQAMELARQVGASEAERSIVRGRTVPANGEGHKVEVTTDPTLHTDIQVRKYDPDNPLQIRPNIQVTSQSRPGTRGYAAVVDTSAGTYLAAKNTEGQKTTVYRNGERVTIKNPKAAKVVARLALKKAGQVIEQLPEPDRPQGRQKRGFFGRRRR